MQKRKVRYEKGSWGYIHNCFTRKRTDDPAPFLFQIYHDKPCKIHLNGYAIIPLQEYFDLTKNKYFLGAIKRSKKADIDLWGKP